jgi:hypothetical protein
MQVVIPVGSLCAGELMWNRLNIAAVATLMVMFMFSMTLLMLIASSFVMTKSMVTVTYSLKLVVPAIVIASSWREMSLLVTTSLILGCILWGDLHV